MVDKQLRAVERDAAQGDLDALRYLRRLRLRDCGSPAERIVLHLGEERVRDCPVVNSIVQVARHSPLTAEEILAEAVRILVDEREELLREIQRLRRNLAWRIRAPLPLVAHPPAILDLDSPA